MKSLEDEWIEFRQTCEPRGLTPGEIEDFRRVFYSGASAAWSLVKDLAGQELLFGLVEIEMQLERFFEGLPPDVERK